MKNKQKLLDKENTQKQNRIWVRISSACNNKCIFCLDVHSQDGVFIKKEIVKNNIKNGFKKGYDNRIIISGGEASINPLFPEYIKYAKEIGYNRVQTVTNGNMFANTDFCKKVFDAGLEEVTFSFHGHNSSLHNFLVDTPGAFKKSLKGLIFIKKYYPNIIINIDIVVNKINVKYLPNIIKFFIKLGVFEFDILQIIPFGKGFKEHKQKLFYNILDYKDTFRKTWEISQKDGVHIWTNRFPVEVFEGYEDLIQDPRKIHSEVGGEAEEMFKSFISTKSLDKPKCFGEKCDFCFLKQYCHGFINNIDKEKINFKNNKNFILNGEAFPSDIYKKYGENKNDFIIFLDNKKNNSIKLINVPKCLGGSGIYQNYNDLEPKYNLVDYTNKYINNFYRKKSLRCDKCKYNKECEGIGINFIRSYGFEILKPIN